MLIEKIIRKNWFLLQVVLVFVYVLTHVWALTKLPVFADEAIYIRWSQLIIDDWKQYLFFPLNDGKTPLQMWLMIPFLSFFADPLFAGRLLSVVFGIGQLFLMREIVKRLGGKHIAQFLAMVVTMVLPFWFFFQRMALIDGMLTFFLSGTFLGIVLIVQHRQKLSKALIVNVLLTGASFGAALWTKPSAVFFASVFPLWWVLNIDLKKKQKSFLSLFALAISGAVGICLFLLLKLHPAFGQLFGRGQDFAFTVSQIIAGEWRTSLLNVFRVVIWNAQYLTVVGTLLIVTALFFSAKKKLFWSLALVMMAFIAPLVILGKVFHPRYIFPMSLFSTAMIGLFLEELWIGTPQISKQLSKKIVVLSVMFIAIFSGYFMLTAWINPDMMPLVDRDREQYLEEWSSGHGIPQVVQLIKEQSQQGRVVVATEGYFGTLPDGILLYFHNMDVRNIEIYGIGQPIVEVPDAFIQKAADAKFAYVIVNSHRMKAHDERLKMVYSYPRPNGAPSLDVYEFIAEK